MADAHLSRRARRTFEEEAADRAASQDPTLALAQGLASGENAAVDTDTAAVSRRDRRRKERLAHPLEAWTAEEEMLATGQIPAMTPARIAEQEQISRNKADRAAQEATAASLEFRRLAESDIRRSPALAVEAPGVAAPEVEAPVSLQSPPHAPVSREPAAQPTWAPEHPTAFPGGFEPASEPSWSEQAAAPEQTVPEQTSQEFAWSASRNASLDAEEAPDSEVAPGAGQEGARAGQPVFEPYQPRMALDDAPLAVAHPVHDEAPFVSQSESVDAPVVERSNIFDTLFPPGSRQAKTRQQDPFAAGSPEAPAPAESGQIPILLPPLEVPGRDTNPIDEIRRLAAEALSRLEGVSRTDEAVAAAAAAGLAPDPSTAAEFDSLRSASSRSAVQAPGAPPTQQGPSRVDAPSEFSWEVDDGRGPSANPADVVPTFDSIAGLSHHSEPEPDTSSGGLAPHHAVFDQLPQPGSGATYVRGVEERFAPTTSGQFQMPGQPQAPQGRSAAPQGLAGPQGPAWASHPLNAAQGGAAEASDFTPLSNVPTPDFSGLYQQGSPGAFPPLTGAINIAALNNAEFHDGDMNAPGQMPSVRRLDLQEVGGAKHFKWLHLAVIGALMFVLGVVIYNAAFAS